MLRAKFLKVIFICVSFASFCAPVAAEIELFNQDGTTVSVDASFNTFYVNTSTDNDISGNDRDQSRVKMGLLPNWLGMTFSREVGDLTFGGRSSFWISINDSDETPTDGLVDTRQFYGTVDGDFGQLLFGKDFTLFSRSNIFLDEILLGYGWVNDTAGLVDGGNVSFGNIGSGYIYPLPTSQITYRTPTFSGVKLAIGLIDPSRTAEGDDAEESAPRIEGELTYDASWDEGSLTGWLGFLQQKSESSTNEVDSTGISYGMRVNVGGLTLHASGYDGEAVGWLIGPADSLGLGLNDFVSEGGEDIDSSGWLAQASYTFGSERLVISAGESELENSGELLNETQVIAWFHNVNDYFTTVVEFNQNEIELNDAVEEADTFALGLIMNF